jgi:hypothetical protein
VSSPPPPPPLPSVPADVPACHLAGCRLGFGRIGISEKAAPVLLENLV